MAVRVSVENFGGEVLQAKISNTAVISAIMVKLLVLVFLIISSLLLFPSGIQYGDGRTGFCPKSG